MPAERVILLGPQREPTVDQVVLELEPDGPLATVTAGWQEREPDDAELDGLLAGRSVNLGLYGRWLDIAERDHEFAVAVLEHAALLDELRLLHLVQLESALTALRAVTRRSGERPAAVDAAAADARAVVHLVDDRHSLRVHDANDEFHRAFGGDQREVIAQHCTTVREVLEQAGALVIAGGHVGVLLRLMRLFRVAESIPASVVAWSAGAMTLMERVVLFHDRTPQGPAPVEIYDNGIGLVKQLVVLPDAQRRLMVDDALRMAELALRFEPARCVTLDKGARLDLDPLADPADELPPNAQVVWPDGHILAREER